MNDNDLRTTYDERGRRKMPGTHDSGSLVSVSAFKSGHDLLGCAEELNPSLISCKWTDTAESCTKDCESCASPDTLHAGFKYELPNFVLSEPSNLSKKRQAESPTSTSVHAVPAQSLPPLTRPVNTATNA